MLKLFIVLTLVICSHSIRLASGVDDDFAEFDDLMPQGTQEEVLDGGSKPNAQRPLETRQDPNKIEVKAGDAERKLDEAFDTTLEEGTEKKPDLKLVNVPLPRIYKWESYYVEIAFVLASFLYFVSFIVGSNKNHKFAHGWYEQTRDILKQQFSLVGGAPQLHDGPQKRDEDSDSSGAVKKQRGLIKVSESMYTLWNSGRVGVDGLLVEVNLLKRQDLFSMALNLMKLSKDTLILRFLLPQDGYENFVFCLAHKSHAAKLVRDMIDINTFCPKRKPLTQLGLNIDRLFVMSELSDVTSFIIDHNTVNFLKKNEKTINFIHITDQYSTQRSEEVAPMQRLAKPKRLATFSFSLPTNGTDQAEFILFALSLLDRLRRFKLARDSKQKSEKNRQKITDILQKTAFSQRQEAAQAKKEELRRLEKERIYNEDDPEKQRRWEKKEAKRELKKNKMRVKQLKVKSM